MEEERDELVEEQEQAAGAEAGAIGGNPGGADVPPAEQPLREAGQGESEGFEQAEADLIAHAEDSTGDGAPRLERLASEEAEPDPAVHSEADEEEVADA